jgi:anti-sigma28 factor (negative regulator of flagellin synthesis)
MLNQPSEYLEVDTHRISTLRSQLDENSYIVNSRQIADKIIDIELALSEWGKATC